MNTREYIESGMLELYVMGSLSKEETLDVEKIVQSNPEIMQEFIRVESALIDYAQANAMEPPFELRALIMEKIEKEAKLSGSLHPNNHAVPVHPIHTNTSPSFYKYLAAASVTLLIFSGIGNYTFWNKIKTAESEIAVFNSSEMLSQFFLITV